MTAWHLRHFFILRAHSAGSVRLGRGGGAGPRPSPLPAPAPRSPSHTVRCWQGENSTSSAGSEHTRHSAGSGPEGAAAGAFARVSGALSAGLGPGAAPPACRSLRVEEGA